MYATIWSYLSQYDVRILCVLLGMCGAGITFLLEAAIRKTAFPKY